MGHCKHLHCIGVMLRETGDAPQFLGSKSGVSMVWLPN